MSRRVDTPSEAPLRDWGEALRNRRERYRRRRRRFALVGFGCGMLLGTAICRPAAYLLWNASASAPLGLYAVRPGGAFDVGDMVIAGPPAAIRDLAASRDYLPLGVPLVKRVAAGPGERICAIGRSIIIEGRTVAERQRTDARGRPMPWWTGCRSLRAHQYLLLMADVPASFDGRYFGISDGADIIGAARLLWRR